MLRELYITNFALIDEVRVCFGQGFNVFTGETGVGKSMVIDALNILLGGRASTDFIRSGKEEATVDGIFEINDGETLDSIKKICELDVEDNEIILHRSVLASGRNRCHINGMPITVSMLREIGNMLVDIHGQHDHESLLHSVNQMTILDSFGNLTAQRNKFSQLYQRALAERAKREELMRSQQTRADQIELYKFQINEIDEAQLQPGELESLENERKVLANAEKIREATASGYNKLYESEDSIFDALKAVTNEIESVADIDEKLKPIMESCNQSLFHLEDAAFELRQYAEAFDFDPQRLQQVEDRLDEIRKLRKKYGDTIEDILQRRNELQSKLEALSKENEDLSTIHEELEALVSELKIKGDKLSDGRRKIAKKLGRLVESELADLGMVNAKFEVAVTHNSLPDSSEDLLDLATSSGFDHVEFLISPNPGEEVKPLRRIASGGEISRVMLALKHRLAQVDKKAVLVFDEIDANIGGRIGDIVGEKLSAIARQRQVICITHLPQIASFADRQFKIHKDVVNRKTYSKVEQLSGSSRIHEIADMIRGAGKSDITLEQAKEMLLAAERSKK